VTRRLAGEPGGRAFSATLRPEDNGWLSEELAYDPGGEEGWPFADPPGDFTEPPWMAWLRAEEQLRETGRGPWAADALLAAETAPFRLARPGRRTVTTCLGQVFSAVSDSLGHAAMAAWVANQPRLAEQGILRWDPETGTAVLTLPPSS
jgi:hypothetical protein